MPTDLWEYSKVLAEQLRLNGMREERVREVVAEVQHHVLDTQQDPVEAFGQPTDYAMTWVAPSSRRWIVRSVAAMAGVTSLVSLPRGLLGPEAWGSRVDIASSYVYLWLIWLVCMGVLPWTAEVWLARRSRRRAGGPGGAPVWAVLMGVSLLVMILVWVGGSMLFDDRGLAFTAPKWALVTIGVAGLPGLAFIGSHRNVSLPERPGTTVTWKTRVRRAFINR